MTPPRLTGLATVRALGGGEIQFSRRGELVCSIEAAPETERAWAPLLQQENAVRITIEPAAVEGAPAAPAAAALDFLRQASRVVCDAHPENDSDTLRRVMRLVESARVALADAAPATPPRPAEEIAREVVLRVVTAGGGQIAVQLQGLARSPDVEPYEAGVAAVAAIVRRSREGATSALQPAQPRDLAGRIRVLTDLHVARWLEASGDDATILMVVIDRLKKARDLAQQGRSVAVIAGELRRGWRAWAPIVDRAADELEAIVRECGEGGR